MEKEILTLREAAELLKVSYGTIRNWIRRGKIPALREDRTYRIKRSDIERRFKKQA